ncbi:MAG: metal ABC transporter ATP-binding protein [Bacteroidales bacterium]|nr:metal ABC transporter ATP-binding protein [Bacteroidales bacterium]
MNSQDKKALIELRDLSFRREERVILDHVNLTVNRGDFMAITGPNGGGKTTLLRLILRLLKPDSGRIIFYDTEGRPTVAAPKFGYLPQKNSVDSHFPITVREVVSSGLLSDNTLSKDEKEVRVDEALALIGLEDLATRPIGKLSGGQLQRVLFGRAIVSRPPILVLDEPLSYLDKHFESHLYKIVAELAKHTTILLVSHEMSEIGAMANRHIIVDGSLHECTAAHHYVKTEC